MSNQNALDFKPRGWRLEPLSRQDLEFYAQLIDEISAGKTVAEQEDGLLVFSKTVFREDDARYARLIRDLQRWLTDLETAEALETRQQALFGLGSNAGCLDLPLREAIVGRAARFPEPSLRRHLLYFLDQWDQPEFLTQVKMLTDDADGRVAAEARRILEEWMRRKPTRNPGVDGRLQIAAEIEDNRRAFEAQSAELIEAHPGCFVVYCRGERVGMQPERVAALQEAMRACPGRRLTVFQVKG